MVNLYMHLKNLTFFLTLSQKKKIVGKKTPVTDAVAIVNPKDGEEISSASGIRETILNYCGELLTNRQPSEEFKDDILLKKNIHELRMSQIYDDINSDLTIDSFNATYDRIAKKPGNKFKFITNAGPSFKGALFNLCRRAWNSEQLPDEWCNSSLVQLYKGSGSMNLLSNHRFIHMKDEIPKFFGNLVMDQAKETIFKNMPKFQIGTRPGHRAQEHLFVIKSVIALYEKYDKPVWLTTWDISKYFDSESLVDVLNELHRSGVQGKLYRLLYLMNRNVRIQVQTPVGPTSKMDTGETLGQGSVEGAVASAVNLANGVRDFFDRSEDEICYHGLELGPLLFQDDVARLSLDRLSTQSGNERMRNVAETKLLSFNSEKSCFVIFGSERRRQELMKDLYHSPLLLSGKEMKNESSIKYLGDQLSEKGLPDSVRLTVMKRKGLVSRAIFEIKSVLNDCRAHITGGLVSGLNLWEVAVLPMLLYNAETWLSINRKTIDILENLQLNFLRSILGVGPGCPSVLLYAETGTILMEYRVLEKKLNFLHHLHNLPVNSLASEVLAIQTKEGLPGIVEECQDFLAKYEIYNLKQFSKLQFKNFVRKKISELNKDKLLVTARKKQYKKVKFDELETNDFKLKEYLRIFKIDDAKLRFRLKS